MILQFNEPVSSTHIDMAECFEVNTVTICEEQPMEH